MKKIIIYILVISSLLLTLVGCSKHSKFNDEYTVWKISEDGSTLTDGTNNYTKYGELPLGMRIENKFFMYSNYVDLEDTYYNVYASSCESGIRYLFDYTLGIIAFVNNESDVEKLDSFLAGNISAVKVIDYTYSTYFDIDYGLVSELDSLNTDKINIPVKKLSSADCYDIVFFGIDDCLAYSHGAIYSYENELYYINYDKLDNSYFDNLGNFSFGRGTVDMYKLPESLKGMLSEKIENAYYYYDEIKYEWEDYAEDEEMSREEALGVIISTVLILGVIIPILPLGIGVIILLKKKDQTDPSTYILIAASVIWIIAGIILLILSL